MEVIEANKNENLAYKMLEDKYAHKVKCSNKTFYNFSGQTFALAFSNTRTQKQKAFFTILLNILRQKL